MNVVGNAIELRVGQALEFDACPAHQQVLYVPGLDYWLAFSGDEAARVMHVKSQELNVMARRL